MKTKPTADMTMVTRAKIRNSPTGSAAIALNSSTVRPRTGRWRRYCPSLVFKSQATLSKNTKYNSALCNVTRLEISGLEISCVLPWGHHKNCLTVGSNFDKASATELCCWCSPSSHSVRMN